MAVSRKGWRKITVGGKLYYWRANGTDWDIHCVVITKESFESGASPQQLRIHLNYDHFKTPSQFGGTRCLQQAAISPKVIRLAIEFGMSKTPPFTGEVGEVDIVLEGAVLDELQVAAHLDSSGSRG